MSKPNHFILRFSVWLDTEDIPAGCDWHAAIGTGLDQCKALIAVISNKYINSRYCKSELYTANGDQKLIFPVIIENVDFSCTERARGVKYVVSGINWTMFRPGYDDYQLSLDKLVSGMKEQGVYRLLFVYTQNHKNLLCGFSQITSPVATFFFFFLSSNKLL